VGEKVAITGVELLLLVAVVAVEFTSNSRVQKACPGSEYWRVKFRGRLEGLAGEVGGVKDTVLML